jgi:hypothetical protein
MTWRLVVGTKEAVALSLIDHTKEEKVNARRSSSNNSNSNNSGRK